MKNKILFDIHVMQEQLELKEDIHHFQKIVGKFRKCGTKLELNTKTNQISQQFAIQ